MLFESKLIADLQQRDVFLKSVFLKVLKLTLLAALVA